MLTYDLTTIKKGELYEALYKMIRDDIKRGTLTAGEKLPSKRALAKNLGVSTITVESAYAQLISEGYVYSLPKRGYYIAKLEAPVRHIPVEKSGHITLPQPRQHYRFDFSLNQTNPAQFPFATWKKLLREVIAEESQALMEKSPSGGVLALRQAIAAHLRDFRGIDGNGFDGRGNFACGIKEQIIFPEIDFEKVDAVRGMDVCFVTTAKTDEEGKELLKALGAPFAENN